MSSEQSSHLSAAGIKFGGAEATTIVGRGRFGAVWKCDREGYAVKVFRTTGDAIDAFLHEAAILKQLNTHAAGSGTGSGKPTTPAPTTPALTTPAPTDAAAKHVTRMIDSGVIYTSHPNIALHCWYTMPLESNSSVKGSIALYVERYGCALPVDIVHAITRSLFQALAFIHAAGVIHADVKPANILLARGCSVLSDEIHVKLSDFGAASLITDEDSDACGTAYYCAPETYADEPITPAIDIWAAGATIYDMLTYEHLIDIDDTETNYVLHRDMSSDDDVLDDYADDMDDDVIDEATLAHFARTDYDVLDDANDCSTGASEDESVTERNMMIVCEKLFGRPPASTRAIFDFYDGNGQIEGVAYPIPRVEIVDLLLQRHRLGDIEPVERIVEIANFIVSCMRYRPSDRVTAADALKTGWLSVVASSKLTTPQTPKRASAAAAALV